MDFIGYMKGIIAMHTDALKYLEDCSLKWELIKMEIRSATISYSKVQASHRREYENDLNGRYTVAHSLLEKSFTDENFANVNFLKNEIEKINALKTEGARIRSKATFVEQNEKK